MTQKSLLRMLKFECLIYGARALTWGLPIGFILGLAVFRIVGTVYSERFYLPWQPYVIVVVCVFAVVFLSMRYAVRRVRTENPIEALKRKLEYGYERGRPADLRRPPFRHKAADRESADKR